MPKDHIFTALLLSLVCAGGFVSCGAKEKSDGMNEGTPVSEEYAVTLTNVYSGKK